MLKIAILCVALVVVSEAHPGKGKGRGGYCQHEGVGTDFCAAMEQAKIDAVTSFVAANCPNGKSRISLYKVGITLFR